MERVHIQSLLHIRSPLKNFTGAVRLVHVVVKVLSWDAGTWIRSLTAPKTLFKIRLLLSAISALHRWNTNVNSDSTLPKSSVCFEEPVFRMMNTTCICSPECVPVYYKVPVCQGPTNQAQEDFGVTLRIVTTQS